MGQRCSFRQVRLTQHPIIEISKAGIWGKIAAVMLGKMCEVIHKHCEKRDKLDWPQLLSSIQEAERQNRARFEKAHKLLPWDDLWKIYDTNDDKDLSQEECRAATVHAVTELRRLLPPLAEYLAPMILQLIIPPDPAAAEAVEEKMEKAVAEFPKILDYMVEDARRISNVAWEKMREKGREEQIRQQKIRELERMREGGETETRSKKIKVEKIGRAEFERFFISTALEVLDPAVFLTYLRRGGDSAFE